MKLYDFLPSGNGYKARLILAHRGLRYEYVPVDILRAETRTAEFLSRNPNGRIPVLELDDGTRLCESNAILYYLRTRLGSLAGRVARTGAGLAVAVLRAVRPRTEHRHGALLAERAEARADPVIRRGAGAQQEPGRAALQVMETHLAGQPYFVGGRFTIADIALYAYTHVAPEGGFDLMPYPNVRAWRDRVRGRRVTSR